MNTFKLEKKSIAEFKSRMTLPKYGSQVINEHARRFCVLLDGKPTYYVFTREEWAAYKLDRREIDCVVSTENGVRMYKKTFKNITINRHSAFTQREERKEVLWEDGELTDDQILELAAREEYEEVGRAMGIIKAKVIQFTRPIQPLLAA